jgi:hypothetical protein
VARREAAINSDCHGRDQQSDILCEEGKRNGAPEEIRTPDPQIRSLVLYPAELRVRLQAVRFCLRGDPLPGAVGDCKRFYRGDCHLNFMYLLFMDNFEFLKIRP